MIDQHPAQRGMPIAFRRNRRGLLRALAAFPVALAAADVAAAKEKCKSRSCCNGRCVDPVDRPGLKRK